MKTIEEALNIAYDECKSNAYFGNGFKKGVKFAQQFINIEDEKPEYYEPVIIELQNSVLIAWRSWSESVGDTYTINGTDIYLMAKEVKRWRPIKFK